MITITLHWVAWAAIAVMLVDYLGWVYAIHPHSPSWRRRT